MRTLILAGAALLLLSGCLGQNRLVKARRSKADVASGASIHSGSASLWWRTPVYADTPRDENPWEEFIHPNPYDQWWDPWATDPASNYGAMVFPKVKPLVSEPALKPSGGGRLPPLPPIDPSREIY